MNIQSYVAIPFSGRLSELVQDLRAVGGNNCDVVPAIDGHEVAIVLVECADKDTEDALMKRFSDLPSLQSMALTFASVPTPVTDDVEVK